MEKVKVLSVITVIAFCVMFFSFILDAEADQENIGAGAGAGAGNKKEFPVKMKWQDAYALVTGSPRKVAQIMSYVTSQVKNTIFPPNLQDLKKPNEAEPIVSTDTVDGGAGEKVKMAVGKSFKATKDAVEESAKSAANVVGEAVHKATEKGKKITPTSTSDSHTDL